MGIPSHGPSVLCFSAMVFVEFVCRVLVLYPAWVFITPPRFPCCLPFAAVLLGIFPELLSDGRLLFHRLSLIDGCVQVAPVEVMIGGGRRIGWLAASRIGGGEHNRCLSDVRFCLGFTIVGLIFCVFFLCF